MQMARPGGEKLRRLGPSTDGREQPDPEIRPWLADCRAIAHEALGASPIGGSVAADAGKIGKAAQVIGPDGLHGLEYRR